MSIGFPVKFIFLNSVAWQMGNKTKAEVAPNIDDKAKLKTIASGLFLNQPDTALAHACKQIAPAIKTDYIPGHRNLPDMIDRQDY